MSAILTVDDSASIRHAIKTILAGAGHEITSAADGVDGLQRAANHRFDLVITDLNMPNMDGLTMIRELRKRPSYAGVPILFLTTETAESAKQQAKQAGATGWLTKPFDPTMLVRVVQKVLAR